MIYLNKNREIEPIVIDALRQRAIFVKIEEGYHHFWESQTILNFYESIICVTKIYAMIDSIFSEMIAIHKPENGQAYSSLNEAIL